MYVLYYVCNMNILSSQEFDTIVKAFIGWLFERRHQPVGAPMGGNSIYRYDHSLRGRIILAFKNPDNFPLQRDAIVDALVKALPLEEDCHNISGQLVWSDNPYNLITALGHTRFADYSEKIVPVLINRLLLVHHFLDEAILKVFLEPHFSNQYDSIINAVIKKYEMLKSSPRERRVLSMFLAASRLNSHKQMIVHRLTELRDKEDLWPELKNRQDFPWRTINAVGKERASFRHDIDGIFRMKLLLDNVASDA